MEIVVLIARILFVAVFAGSSIGHLTQSGAMAGYAASKGVPAPKIGVIGSGALMLVGAIMVALGLWGDLGALLILAAVLPIAFIIHPFWKEEDAGAKMNEQTQFMKDISLSGGALALFALFTWMPELGLTASGPLLGL